MTKELTPDDFERVVLPESAEHLCEGCYFDSDKDYCYPISLNKSVEDFHGECRLDGDFIFKLKTTNNEVQSRRQGSR